MTVLALTNVQFAYGRGPDVLTGVNLTVNQGDFLAVLGPNGGGKTTLLQLILGLLQPNQGSIQLFGGKPREHVHRVGYLPQHTNVNPDFPIAVMDVVLMGRLGLGARQWRYSLEDKRQAVAALEKVGMSQLQDRRIGTLSGGQRQRVLIARALITEPELLLLDEPTSSVDAVGKGDLYKLLKQLNQSMTIITVSHDIGVIPTMVKSIACVNRTLHFHPAQEMTPEMVEMVYGIDQDACPVELIAHGIPHRMLPPHQQQTHEHHTGI